MLHQELLNRPGGPIEEGRRACLAGLRLERPPKLAQTAELRTQLGVARGVRGGPLGNLGLGAAGR